MTAADMARLDVPLPVLEAAIRHTALKAQATREGLLAERRHHYDLDPDSACCPTGFTCPACPPGGTA